MALCCILVSFMAQKYVLLFGSYSTFSLNVQLNKRLLKLMTITIRQNVASVTVPSMTLTNITYFYQDNIRELRGFFYLCISIVNIKRNIYMTTVDVILTFTGT